MSATAHTDYAPAETEGATAGLVSGFLRSARSHPARPALEVEENVLTYADLYDRAARLATVLDAAPSAAEAPVVAVFAYRSESAYAGVLGALLSGRGYVALNRKFPMQRTRFMLENSDARAVVVDGGCAPRLAELLEGLETPLLVVLADQDDVESERQRWPMHTVLGARDVAAAAPAAPPVVDTSGIAYLMYTSGSTGMPKAVQVMHRNARQFVDFVAEHWQITEHDRFSHTFDMTFDLSVSDMFVCWERGACLCVLPEAARMKPGKFIRERELTVWYSVPSLGLLMKRLGMLKPDTYPSLRLSLFCGEAMPVELAQAWAEAAPNSAIENVYGPTEVTITCACYRWDGERSAAEAEVGIVPIGSMYPSMQALVVGTDLLEVAPGEIGELLLVGPQVTPGYWRNPEKTAQAFVHLDGDDRVHYRTGDLVRRPTGDRPMTYHGRIDHQVKINGHRVELGEIEAAIRDATGIGEVVALGWPRTASGYGSVSAFVRADSVDVADLQQRLGGRLPEYMVPRAIHAIDEMPLNSNGKFDRNALTARLEAMQ
jgi:amino acid adenylation domain-containing protein